MPEQNLFEPAPLASEKFAPRPYQKGAIDAAVKFYNGSANYHGIEILPTGSGKSVVIANIAKELDGKTIVFQPSKEILEQNYAKFRSYGYRASIYSASAGEKRIDKVTFATIGSVAKKHYLFKEFKNIIIDECFPYDQYISTEAGKIKIGRFVERFNSGIAMPKVYSFNARTNVMESKKVVAAVCNGEKQLLELCFSKSVKIRTTSNHPFLTNAGWKTASELREGDCILCSKPNGTYSYIPNEDQIDFLLGSLLGDGSIDRTRKVKNINRFRFIQGEKQEKYLLWKAKLLNCESSEVKVNGFAGNKAFRFNSKVMYFNDEYCSKEYAINNLSPKVLAISWMDDGHLSKLQNSGTLYSCADSELLTIQLCYKLKELGIFGEVKSGTSKLSQKPYYFIKFNKEAVNKISDIIALYVHPSMAFKITDNYRFKAGVYEWNSQFNQRGAAVLLSKKQAGSSLVYNIQVEENETYTITSARYNKKHKESNDGIIVHNCHLVNSRTKEVRQSDGSSVQKGGMYYEFIKSIENCKVLGLTATPYRLTSTMEGAMLKFLTRTRPRIFSDVLYCVQNNVLFEGGYLAPLRYFSFDVIDRKMLQMNSSGTDFTEASLKSYYRRINFPKLTAYWANRVLAKRNNLLIFCSLIEEANATARLIPGAVVITGQTPKLQREKILSDFKSGRIRCVINVGVLTTGFDYPALEAVMLARSTMSLALYYQIIGRVMRLFTYPDGTKKEGYVIDLGGNINFFGKIETMQVVQNERGLYSIMNNGRHLTNVTFSKN